jgi:hypothetical protein
MKTKTIQLMEQEESNLQNQKINPDVYIVMENGNLISIHSKHPSLKVKIVNLNKNDTTDPSWQEYENIENNKSLYQHKPIY